jgi:hypothetical protein
MRASTDTVHWSKIMTMPPEFMAAAWAGPDEVAWKTTDTEDLLRGKPPATVVGIWCCDTPQPGDNRVALLKRSFRGKIRLYKAAKYSRDLQIHNRVAWFDFATPDMNCIDELTDTIQRNLGYSAGIVLLQGADDPARVAERISRVLEKIWNRIESSEERVAQRQRRRTIHEPWSDAERLRLISEVPGHIVVASDSNTTSYLLGFTPLTIRWLTAAGRSRLDLDHVWRIGVDIIDPEPPI